MMEMILHHRLEIKKQITWETIFLIFLPLNIQRDIKFPTFKAKLIKHITNLSLNLIEEFCNRGRVYKY